MRDIIFKTIQTYRGNYVYDRHTNSIISLEPREFNEIRLVEQGLLEEQDSAVIKKYQQSGLFQPNIIKKIEHAQTYYLEPYIKNSMKQLTLQVTQQCNLRCEYCAYSGIYNNNRKHSNKRMNFETAKKAIDFFLEHTSNTSNIIIGFYGGEPLLEFNLIKQCVTYVEQIVEGKKVLFNMTTNGTLLTDDIIEFMANHNIHISISLDGSKEEHDKSRKFRNGNGSFDTIIENIKKIREKYPSYEKNISIMTTVNPHMDLGCVLNYFSTDEILNKHDIIFNTMNASGLNNSLEYNDDYYVIRNYEYMKLLLALTGKINMNHVSPLVRKSISLTKRRQEAIQKHSEISPIMHHNGPCLPGARKLFVRYDGALFPCERVNETLDYFCIGNLDDGINLSQAKRILNIGKVNEEECKNCWAIRHCSICAGQIEFQNEPTKKDKNVECANSKKRVLFELHELCVLNEFGINSKE